MSDMTIEVQQREAKGKNVNRRLRASGLVPAVVYGGDRDPVAIQVEGRKVRDLIKKAGSENAVFLLQLAGTSKSRHTMIRELETDSITGEMIHIDFQRVNMDEVVRVEVPIEVHGLAVGVKLDGGILDFVTREVEVECLPDAIPQHLDVEVSELHVGQHLEAGDLQLPDGVTLITDANRVIVSIAGKAKEEEVDEEGTELLTDTEAEPELA